LDGGFNIKTAILKDIDENVDEVIQDEVTEPLPDMPNHPSI